jgi:hypothetical protein
MISTSFITSQALTLREQIRKRMNSGISWPRSMEMTRIISTQNLIALMRVMGSRERFPLAVLSGDQVMDIETAA